MKCFLAASLLFLATPTFAKTLVAARGLQLSAVRDGGYKTAEFQIYKEGFGGKCSIHFNDDFLRTIPNSNVLDIDLEVSLNDFSEETTPFETKVCKEWEGGEGRAWCVREEIETHYKIKFEFSGVVEDTPVSLTCQGGWNSPAGEEDLWNVLLQESRYLKNLKFKD